MAINLHRLAEERSLADGSVARTYADRWDALLALPLDQLIAAMLDPSEAGRAMRQCSPFAGALDARERWRIRREVRARLGPPQ